MFAFLGNIFHDGGIGSVHRINAFSFHGGIAVTPVAPGSQKWKVSESCGRRAPV